MDLGWAVDTLRCEACEEDVREAFLSFPGVRGVDVDLREGFVHIDLDESGGDLGALERTFRALGLSPQERISTTRVKRPITIR